VTVAESWTGTRLVQCVHVATELPYIRVCVHTYLHVCCKELRTSDVYGYVASQNDDDNDDDNDDYPQQNVSDIQGVMIGWVCLLQTCARLCVTQRNHS
jgi:hypothetical protein